MSSQEHPLGISFEFFPPNTDAGREKLIHVRDELAARNPRFFSVTYGAGGSTQARTRDIVRTVSQSGITTAPHLSCIGSEKAQLRDLLAQYREGCGKLCPQDECGCQHGDYPVLLYRRCLLPLR